MKGKLRTFTIILMAALGCYLILLIVNEIQVYNRSKNTVVIPMVEHERSDYIDVPPEVMEKLLQGVMEVEQNETE